MGFRLFYEFIADSFDGDDVFFTDFLPQLADVYVDGSLSDYHFVSPDVGIDLLPCEEFSRRGKKQVEQSKLFSGEGESSFVGDDFVPFAVDADRRFRFRFDAFENRLNPAHQDL